VRAFHSPESRKEDAELLGRDRIAEQSRGPVSAVLPYSVRSEIFRAVRDEDFSANPSWTLC
jgi:hypothetical protein